MKWEVEFYHAARGALARYTCEASTAAAAVGLARADLLVEHAPAKRRRRLTLFEQARRIGGEDASGWVLHRIVSG